MLPRQCALCSCVHESPAKNPPLRPIAPFPPRAAHSPPKQDKFRVLKFLNHFPPKAAGFIKTGGFFIVARRFSPFHNFHYLVIYGKKEVMRMTAKKRSGLFDSQRVLYLPVDCIVPNPSQPRTTFVRDGLEELADSIAEHGILQPLSVRQCNGRYQLISGERRLRAARMVGLTSVPCILVDVTDTESALLALVENLQRRDLDFMEEALALRRLIVQHGLSQEEAARKVGKSQSAVANKLRLLKLAPEVLETVKSAGLTERHARCLLRLPPEQRLAAAQHMAQQQLTVAKAEAYVDKLLAPPPPPQPVRKAPIYHIRDVRFFLNTIDRSVRLMQSAGVPATSQQDKKDGVLTLTVRIPVDTGTSR